MRRPPRPLPTHHRYTHTQYIQVGMSSIFNECSIGNALLSKYPLKNLQQLTFTSQCCRYGGRWGGRSAVKAKVEVGGKEVEVCSTHLESGQSDFKSVINGTYVRERQAAEVRREGGDARWAQEGA